MEVDQMISYTRLSKCAFLCILSVVAIAAQVNAQDDDLENLILTNPGFEEDFVDWWQGVQGGAEAVMQIDSKDAIDGRKCAYVDVTTVTGTNWHVGLVHSNLTFEQGVRYTVDFFAKADAMRSIALEVKVSPPLPYENVTNMDINLNEEWTEYSHSFVSGKDYPGTTQVAFWLGDVKGELWIDGVRLYEGEKQDREDVLPEISVQAKSKLITSWSAIKANY
jgi:hypothetical protein